MYEKKINALREKRIAYGVKQDTLAADAGITRVYLSYLENGRKHASADLLQKLDSCLERYNPDRPMDILFDYCRIRFPTTDAGGIVKDLLQLDVDYMMHQDYAFYGYTEQLVMGDVVVMFSPDVKKGVLLELKGKGCRQMECYLQAQNRTWIDLLHTAVKFDGAFKRIDLAINDRAGLLDIPMLAEKCKKGESKSVFRKFQDYQSGAMIQAREEYKNEMGTTLYLGSMKSEIYFCIYEKNYEQYIKEGIPLEEAEIKNRFELRLKNERAEQAVKDILKYGDAGYTAFSIINRYISFLDRKKVKKREVLVANAQWERFISTVERKLRLTTKPEPYSYNKTLNWLTKQVGPTIRMVMEVDRLNGTCDMASIVENAKLEEHHRKKIEQLTVPIEKMIV